MKAFLAVLLLVIAAVPGSQAGTLGRLFFTPAQRAQLEYEHAHEVQTDGGSPSVLMVNGIVQQHGGARTVWINGAAQNSEHGHDPATEETYVPGTLKTIRIKVGGKKFPGFPDMAAPQSSPASFQ